MDILIAHPEPASLSDWKDRYLPRLGPELQARFRELQQPARQLEWLAARVLLLEGLRQLAGCEQPQLGTAADGRPTVDHGTCASISHSQGLVGVAIGPVELGLDLEYARRQRPLRALERYLNAETTADFRHPGDTAAGIAERLSAWTVTEALVKSQGLTIWDGLKAVRLRQHPADPRVELQAPLPGGDWQLWQASLEADWTLALACRGAGAQSEPPRLWRLCPGGALEQVAETTWRSIPVSFPA